MGPCLAKPLGPEVESFEILTRIAGNCFDVLWARHLIYILTSRRIQSVMRGTTALTNNLNIMLSR